MLSADVEQKQFNFGKSLIHKILSVCPFNSLFNDILLFSVFIFHIFIVSSTDPVAISFLLKI